MLAPHLQHSASLSASLIVRMLDCYCAELGAWAESSSLEFGAGFDVLKITYRQDKRRAACRHNAKPNAFKTRELLLGVILIPRTNSVSSCVLVSCCDITSSQEHRELCQCSDMVGARTSNRCDNCRRRKKKASLHEFVSCAPQNGKLSYRKVPPGLFRTHSHKFWAYGLDSLLS